MIDKHEPVTLLEIQIYGESTGKVNWLAENMRPDICTTALNMSKCNKNATIGDLKDTK